MASGGRSSADGGQSSGSGGLGPTGGQSGSSRAACKRGVAYGQHSVEDLRALSKGVSFWYNWDFRPDEDLRAGAYRDAEVEYVPMIWGEKSDRTAARSSIPDGARYLLGFNEPNFGSQANISAVDAAALWPELEAIAQARGLRLVSPAVNFCGGDCQDTDPFRYLDDFFAACSDCQVDAVAIHIYVGCSPSGDNKAEWLINHVETYKERFDKPLWLTEFACDSAASFAEQQAFLEDAVAYLEGEPRIERYAWFAGRADNVPFVDLLGESGVLTSLGEAYVNAPQAEECLR
jgi:Glycosyl hydrolase catalytic core